MKKINEEETKEEVVIDEVDDEICIGKKEARDYWWSFGQRTDRNSIKWIYTINNVAKADLLISFCKRVGYIETSKEQVQKEDYKLINGVRRKFRYNNYVVTLEKIPAIQS